MPSLFFLHRYRDELADSVSHRYREYRVSLPDWRVPSAQRWVFRSNDLKRAAKQLYEHEATTAADADAADSEHRVRLNI